MIIKKDFKIGDKVMIKSNSLEPKSDMVQSFLLNNVGEIRNNGAKKDCFIEYKNVPKELNKYLVFCDLFHADKRDLRFESPEEIKDQEFKDNANKYNL